MATFGEDISMFRRLLVVGDIVEGDWIGGVVVELRPFVVSCLSRFSISSFFLLFGKHMAKRGELVRHLYVE